MKSAQYPVDSKEQEVFVTGLVKEMVKRTLQREAEFTLKIWTVEHRKLARNSNEVLIPGIEVKIH